jgi:TfoX/Sxy family transcriptional regulator of competence genes
MASDQEFVDFVVDQTDPGLVSYRRMFGEYALYAEGRVVALICDNQLFVKPTAAGRAYVGRVPEAPPYPGAKLYFLIEDRLDDRQWISGLLRTTAGELPPPKPKAAPKKKSTRASALGPAARKTAQPRRARRRTAEGGTP